MNRNILCLWKFWILRAKKIWYQHHIWSLSFNIIKLILLLYIDYIIINVCPSPVATLINYFYFHVTWGNPCAIDKCPILFWVFHFIHWIGSNLEYQFVKTTTHTQCQHKSGVICMPTASWKPDTFTCLFLQQQTAIIILSAYIYIYMVMNKWFGIESYLTRLSFCLDFHVTPTLWPENNQKFIVFILAMIKDIAKAPTNKRRKLKLRNSSVVTKAPASRKI